MTASERLVRMMKRIYDADMTTTSGGNLSIRDEDGSIWITPAGIDKGTLTPEDVVHVLADGTVIGKHRPSSEYPFHKHMYEVRPDFGGIVHAHPAGLVGFSLSRVLPKTDWVKKPEEICGTMRMAPYDLPGSTELGDKVAGEFVEGTYCVMLENHGVVCGGATLEEAFLRFETAELNARFQLNCALLGGAQAYDKSLPRKEGEPLAGTEVFPEDDAVKAARENLAAFIVRSVKKQLFSAAVGSFSVKLGEDDFLMQASGCDRMLVTPESLVRVKGGKAEAGKVAGGSWTLHREIYRRFPQFGSITLSQPAASMAFASTDTVYDTHTIPECYIMVRRVEKVPYEKHFETGFGALEQLDHWHPVLLIGQDCLLTVGDTALTAFDRMEVMDMAARALIHTRSVGPLVAIGQKEIEDIEAAFKMAESAGH